MTTKGFDCARPLTASQAKTLGAAGFGFAVRYLVPASMAWKRMIREEAEAITAAGMQIVSVFESDPARARGGAAYGKADGEAAYKEAMAIGQPAGSAIYFAVDFDAANKDFDAIEAYFRAAAAAIPGYGIGVYAEYAVVEEMVRRGAVAHVWQTLAWSGGRKSSKMNIYQYKNGENVSGIEIDLNESYGNEGWWNTMPVDAGVVGVKVVVNDQLVTTGEIKDGRTIAPIAAILQAIGQPYTYNDQQKKIYIYTQKAVK